MTPIRNKGLVRKFFEKGPSGGDIAAADALLARDFSLHVPFQYLERGLKQS